MPHGSRQPVSKSNHLFDSAHWYDLGIDWSARLDRELPVLQEVLGPPGSLGILDAACGTGRHLAALAQRGYKVVGLDYSPDMLAMARTQLSLQGVVGEVIEASFTQIPRGLGPFDGVICVGNSLAAAGSTILARKALLKMAALLRPGGRLLVQVLNFDKLCREQPYVRGPRVRQDGGREYISTKIYLMTPPDVEVISLTLWNEGGWRQHVASARLAMIAQEQLRSWFVDGGLKMEAEWGNYGRAPFNPVESEDLILVGTKAAVSH